MGKSIALYVLNWTEKPRKIMPKNMRERYFSSLDALSIRYKERYKNKTIKMSICPMTMTLTKVSAPKPISDSHLFLRVKYERAMKVNKQAIFGNMPQSR